MFAKDFWSRKLLWCFKMTQEKDLIFNAVIIWLLMLRNFPSKNWIISFLWFLLHWLQAAVDCSVGDVYKRLSSVICCIRDTFNSNVRDTTTSNWQNVALALSAMQDITKWEFVHSDSESMLYVHSSFIAWIECLPSIKSFSGSKFAAKIYHILNHTLNTFLQ